MHRYFITLVLLVSTYGAAAYNFKVRAREHFESHVVKQSTNEYKYNGLSNTLNFWWEKPYDFSFGFSASPVFANLKGETTDIFGEGFKFINVGFEAKYFFIDALKQVFVRGGVGYSQVLPENSAAKSSGSNVYLGLGYEIPFNMFGLALEVAQRETTLSDDITISSFTPSIGFHFYDMF